MYMRLLIIILALMPAISPKSICRTKQLNKKGQLVFENHCCAGYKYSSYTDHNSLCEPICQNGCGKNGTCISPDNCSCDAGYDNLDNKPSNPCVAVCDAGYQKDESTSSCVPVCKTGCPNGHCVSPDNCSCHSGFEKSESDQSCAPICTDKCANACSCLRSYDLVIFILSLAIIIFY